MLSSVDGTLNFHPQYPNRSVWLRYSSKSLCSLCWHYFNFLDCITALKDVPGLPTALDFFKVVWPAENLTRKLLLSLTSRQEIKDSVLSWDTGWISVTYRNFLISEWVWPSIYSVHAYTWSLLSRRLSILDFYTASLPSAQSLYLGCLSSACLQLCYSFVGNVGVNIYMYIICIKWNTWLVGFAALRECWKTLYSMGSQVV